MCCCSSLSHTSPCRVDPAHGYVRNSQLEMVVLVLFACCRQTKPVGKVKIPGKNGLRWYKNVGLGFKTPKEAIEGASWF